MNWFYYVFGVIVMKELNETANATQLHDQEQPESDESQLVTENLIRLRLARNDSGEGKVTPRYFSSYAFAYACSWI